MPYSRKVDIVIIGGGVMGAATAHALRRSGRQVTVFERFSVGHPHGSSHGRSRIFRLSYPDATYVRMAKTSLRMWRELERESGETLLTTLGGLDAGDDLERHVAAMTECGVEFKQLDGRQLARKMHAPVIEPTVPVIIQRDAGILAAERATSAFIRSAVHHGTDVREGEQVVSLENTEADVKVRTSHGLFEAGVAVVAAGGWAAPLLEQVGIDLPVRVTRETVGYFKINGVPPPPLVEWGQPASYSLPSPGDGIKAAQHVAGPEVDPDSPPSANTHSMEIVSAWVQRRFPTADVTPHRVETCLYTSTDDQRFILERQGNVVVGSACSGHGFKFAPLIGERLARLAEGLTI